MRRRWRLREPYVPRPKLAKLEPSRRDKLVRQLDAGLRASPVLDGLGWQVKARRGRFYFEGAAEIVARITPVVGGVLLLEVEGRSSWREVKKARTARPLLACMAGDDKGTFHGLGALDAILSAHGSQRMDMVCAEGHVGSWFYLDLPPSRAASAPEVLYHAFGVPIPVIAEPRAWWSYHRKPAIVEHEVDAVLVDFSASSWSGASFGGRCLYARTQVGWGAYTIKPNQAASLGTAKAWLIRRSWRPW